jgi:AraC-like DNA-binding protein
MIPTFSFSLFELAALAGLVQCVVILVYFAFRAGNFSLAVIPFTFFFVLACAFYLDLAGGYLESHLGILKIMRFWFWIAVCPLSVLFIIQFSDFSHGLSLPHYLILLVIPIALVTSYLLADEACLAGASCPQPSVWTLLTGFIAGTVSMPFLWLKKNLLSEVREQPSGNERYWMIIALLGVNFVLLTLVFLVLVSDDVDRDMLASARTVMGLAFVYISASCLFRIYPPPASLLMNRPRSDELNEEDKAMIDRIREKLELEKVYLESAYSRSDLARELEIPETRLSRLINAHYKKNFPLLLNEYRVEEACQLLRETDAPVNVISMEVGFNSLASFNRVFKDIAGQTASSYRKEHKVSA